MVGIKRVDVVNEPYGTLRIAAGPMAGTIIPIHDGETLFIGRDATMSQIILDEGYTSISRRHCSITYYADAGEYIVTDLSSNGTFLEIRTRLERDVSVALKPGTVIFLADENCPILLQ